MKILVGDKGNVDFDSPIPMTKDQQEYFIKFMKEELNFNPVQPMETNNFRIDRIGDRFFQRRWDDKDEIAMLLDINMDTDKVCALLGRTWMGVVIKRGEVIPDLMMWAKSKGYDLIHGDIEKIIEEYLAEKKEKAKKKRSERSLKTQEINKLNNEIYNKGKLLESIELRKKVGLTSPKDHEIIKITKDEIKALKNELLEKYDIDVDYTGEETIIEVDI